MSVCKDVRGFVDEVCVPALRMMFRLRGCGLAAVLSLACAAPGIRGQMGGVISSIQNADANVSPVDVTGVVVNANTGSPIPRALVQLGGRAMLTDHDGKFEFDQFAKPGGLPQVTKPGYYSTLQMGHGARILTGSDLSKPLRLRLYPEALITGRITAPDGSPLRGVPISAMRSVFDQTIHRWMPGGTATTNERGEFRLTVSPGQYRLQTYNIIRRSNNGDVIMPLVFPANTSGTTLDLIRLQGGDEQHFDLRPSVGHAYTVWISAEPVGQGLPVLQVHTTNGTVFATGGQPGAGDLYRVELPNGSYTLTATKYSPDGEQTAETNVTVAGHDVSGVVLQFQPVPEIPLEIHVDPDTSDNESASSPMNPSALGLMLLRDSGEMDQRTYAIYPNQKHGWFGFLVAPGSYRLEAQTTFSHWYVESATYGDRDLLRQNMEVTPGSGGLPVEITVSNQTGSLTGNACLSNTIMDCRVYLIPAMPGLTPAISANIVYMQGGTVAHYSANLAPGTYRAIAFDPQPSFDPSSSDDLAPYSSHVRTVVIHAGDQATLDLEAVTEAEIKQ